MYFFRIKCGRCGNVGFVGTKEGEAECASCKYTLSGEDYEELARQAFQNHKSVLSDKEKKEV